MNVLGTTIFVWTLHDLVGAAVLVSIIAVLAIAGIVYATKWSIRQIVRFFRWLTKR